MKINIVSIASIALHLALKQIIVNIRVLVIYCSKGAFGGGSGGREKKLGEGL